MAASSALSEVLAGPERPARVVAAARAAVHLVVDAPVGVVSIVTRDAVALPGAVVLGASASERPLDGLDVEIAGVVGAGRVVVGRLVLAPFRWRDARVPRWRTDASGLARAQALLLAGAARTQTTPDPLLPDLGEHLDEVVGALAAGDAARAVTEAAGLLGRGRGFTPAGDDALAGLLLAMAAVDAAGSDRSANVRHRFAIDLLARAADATGPVPAALLAHAARGEAARPVRDLVVALARDDGRSTDRVDAALAEVLALGHSSGHDLVMGLAAGLRLSADVASVDVEGDRVRARGRREGVVCRPARTGSDGPSRRTGSTATAAIGGPR